MKKTSRSKAKTSQSVKVSSHAAAQLATDEQKELFERLRSLRKKLADEAGVPPYVVFSDAHLRDMCVRAPKTRAEFALVNGVGPAKLDRYADVFLAEINR